ncbi:MAG: lipid-A-disaccharide synthase, partial [Deltaproteobacteria bacterium]|nr:lipid-A-disaccharide synthase [Deltaproteobacteria bacterium]
MSNHPHRKKLLIITGETSGDHHGALVLRALSRLDPNLRAAGIGGEELAQAGMKILYHSRNIAVVGLLEVLAHAPQVLKAFSIVKNEIRTSPPDLILLIDYPDFNLRIAQFAHKRGVPVMYYISPQIWAWRQGRAKKIARIVDRMAVIFPFEVPFYEKVGMDVHFVGHPLMDRQEHHVSRTNALNFFGLRDARPIIGLLPGSRQGEINRLFIPMLNAAAIIKQHVPEAQFVVPLAPGLNKSHIKQLAEAVNTPVKIVPNSFHQALAACDLALVVSGTATLETAIAEKPMVIIYKVAPLTYQIGRRLIKVDTIGLANIVAGKKVVPELIQDAASPENIAREALGLLNNPERMTAMQKDLTVVKKALGDGGASERVAQLAHEML